MPNTLIHHIILYMVQCVVRTQALSVGIFPYVLKLLQSPAKELRPYLIFIWTKLLAADAVRALRNRSRGFTKYLRNHEVLGNIYELLLYASELLNFFCIESAFVTLTRRLQVCNLFVPFVSVRYRVRRWIS